MSTWYEIAPRVRELESVNWTEFLEAIAWPVHVHGAALADMALSALYWTGRQRAPWTLAPPLVAAGAAIGLGHAGQRNYFYRALYVHSNLSPVIANVTDDHMDHIVLLPETMVRHVRANIAHPDINALRGWLEQWIAGSTAGMMTYRIRLSHAKRLGGGSVDTCLQKLQSHVKGTLDDIAADAPMEVATMHVTVREDIVPGGAAQVVITMQGRR